ncbi:MAG TPA: Asp-tRNA(Asn)/Glu-tRNA(Gln) amidotransferase subunit GatB [Anaerolineales bacterium]
MASYQPVIGLEVHAELETRSKMFCRCPVVDSTSAEPNSSVCEICCGMPGTLPVINRRAVEFALRVALALDCDVAETSRFARKNYFYPDLPKGFQISQYEMPLATGGRLEIETETGPRLIGIRRVHLEEDTGKLFHLSDHSLIDFNRAGVPLLEIVSEPALHSVDEVHAYATGLRDLLRYLGVNSGDMEKGVIRFEANLSLRLPGDDQLGTRVEIKNLNSFRAMTRALAFEVERQAGILASGQPVRQETLGWDEAAGVTISQRGKEQAEDYRYFPEPDLPPLVVARSWVEQIRVELPELPAAKRARFVEQYELTPYLAVVLTSDRLVADYFEAASLAAKIAPPVKVANWLTGDLFGLLNDRGLTLSAEAFPPENLAGLVDLLEGGTINQPVAKDVLAASFDSGTRPADIVAQQSLEQESDPAHLGPVIDTVLRQNPDQVAQYTGGKTALSHWFFGRVMQATGGKADPQVVRALLEEALQALSTDVDRA